MQNTEKENKKAMIRKKSKKTKEKKEKEPPIISCTLSFNFLKQCLYKHNNNAQSNNCF